MTKAMPACRRGRRHESDCRFQPTENFLRGEHARFFGALVRPRRQVHIYFARDGRHSNVTKTDVVRHWANKAKRWSQMPAGSL